MKKPNQPIPMYFIGDLSLDRIINLVDVSDAD